MINEKLKVELNGFKQKIHIKGDESKDILLFIHGGPGVTNRHICTVYNQDLLEHFMCVAWDQRGSGGSYWGINPETLSIDQLTDDTHELVKYLCSRFNKEKIFAIGGSWGSLLGSKLAYKYPEHLYCFVGFGQFVDGEKNEEISYNFAMEQAKANNDIESVKKLELIGPPVKGCYANGYDAMLIQREVMNKYGGYSKKNKPKGYTSGLAKAYLCSGEYSLTDIIGVLKGNRVVLSKMWPEIGSCSLKKECPEYKIPYFIFDGRLDKNTPADLVQDYFESIKAPYKELIWYEESGHNPLIDEAELFKKNLVDRLFKVKKGEL